MVLVFDESSSTEASNKQLQQELNKDAQHSIWETYQSLWVDDFIDRIGENSISEWIDALREEVQG